MISKRGLAAATATGASLVILATGSAFACDITKFSDSVACNASTGQAVITVNNVDHNLTDSTFTVYVTGSQTPVGTGSLGQGNTPSTQISVPWIAGGSWTVVVSAGNYFQNQNLQPVTAPNTPCGAAATTPVSTPTPTPPVSSPTAATPTPVASPTTVAVVATTTPSVSASPTATLAETGSSGTGMIATFAGALVAAGGGALYFLRRRPAGRRG